jgi:hypothetical protein
MLYKYICSLAWTSGLLGARSWNVEGRTPREAVGQGVMVYASWREGGKFSTGCTAMPSYHYWCIICILDLLTTLVTQFNNCHKYNKITNIIKTLRYSK